MNFNRRLLITTFLLITAIMTYLFWGGVPDSNFIWELRASRIFTILLLGTTGSIATLVFQTITNNRILTPNLMGIDSIYLLIQIILILVLGISAYNSFSENYKFISVASTTMLITTLIYTTLLHKPRGDLHHLLLVGMIFTVFCHAVISFISRILNPTAYAIYQSVAYANLNKANTTLFVLSSTLCIVTLVWLWYIRHRLDVIALGRKTAISLGVNYRRDNILSLIAVTLLVTLSTALVGPFLFFGLLTSALTYRLFNTTKHSILIPGAALIGSLILVLGQLIFEKILNLEGTLSMAVESVGGLIFLILIMRKPQ